MSNRCNKSKKMFKWMFKWTDAWRVVIMFSFCQKKKSEFLMNMKASRAAVNSTLLRDENISLSSFPWFSILPPGVPSASYSWQTAKANYLMNMCIWFSLLSQPANKKHIWSFTHTRLCWIANCVNVIWGGDFSNLVQTVIHAEKRNYG